VTASEWAKHGTKLMLTLTFEGLRDTQQVDPWLCSYAPDRNVMEALSPVRIIDRDTRTTMVENFIREVLRMQEKRALSELLARYDETVSYYTQSAPVDQAFISKEKAKLFADWPSAQCEVVGPIQVTGPTAEGAWHVTVATRFRAENPVTKALSEGEEQIRYVVRFAKEEPKIAGESSTVVKRKKEVQLPFTIASPPPEDRDFFRGERYPDTRERLLTEGEMSAWPEEKLRYMINEMFARYGADFGKAELNKVFSQFKWYTVRQGVSLDEIENREFSEIERQNVKMLGALRDRKKAGR
jgi:hypothetical protein